MKTKIFLLSGLMVAAVSLLVGCDKGPKAHSAANTVANSCQAGQVYIAAHNGCFATAQCASFGANYGYVPQIGQCLPGVFAGGNVNPGGFTGRHMWNGWITYTNVGAYKALIKSLGVCGGGHLNDWMGRHCDEWDNDAAVAFEIYGDGTVPAYGTGTIMSYYDDYDFIQSSFFSGPVSLANQSTAFFLSSWGYNQAYNKVITFEGNVPSLLNGTAPVNQFRLRILVDGAEIGYSDVSLRY